MFQVALQVRRISRDPAGRIRIKQEKCFRPPRSIHEHMQAVQGVIAGGKVGGWVAICREMFLTDDTQDKTPDLYSGSSQPCINILYVYARI